MNTKRIAAVSTVIVVAAAGAAAAVAATGSDDGKKAEDAVLSDAAKRLNVSPEQLRDALSKAEDAQLDQAVKDGKLTQAQADAIKKRRQDSGRVLGVGPGGPHGFGRGFGRAAAGGLDDVAKALGLTRAKLLEQLRDGKSIADIAKAQGKDLDDVKADLKAAASKRLDQAVKDGKLTDAQRDEILSHLNEHIDRLDKAGGKFGPGFGPGGHHGPPDGMGPPDGTDPSGGTAPPAGAVFG